MPAPQNVSDSLTMVFADKDKDDSNKVAVVSTKAVLAQSQHDADVAVTTQAQSAQTLQADFDAFVALTHAAVFGVPPAAPAVKS